VSFAVIEAYLRVLEAEARVASAGARLKTAEALLDEARRYMQVGTASKLDESRAVLQRETERAALTDLRAERDIRKVMLLKLLGLPPGASVELTERFDPPSAVRVDPADDRIAPAHPEIKAAEAQVRTASAERQRASSERLPTISVAGDVGLFGQSVSSNLNTYSVRAMVSVPLYEGGRIAANVRTAEIKTAKAEEAVRDARLQVESQLQIAKVQLDASQEAHAAAAAAVEAARTAVELAQLRFLEGLSTNIEVVTAQESLASAEAMEIGRRYAFHIARATLARAHGDVMAIFQ
jgi:outer membrane protein TolC